MNTGVFMVCLFLFMKLNIGLFWIGRVGMEANGQPLSFNWSHWLY